MNSFPIELPVELREEVSQWTNGDPLAESAWITAAVREKLAACIEQQYLEERASRGSREAYESISAKVPAVAPIDGDSL